MNHQPPASGAERMLHVLATLARHGAAVSAADLATRTAMPVSTLYRHLGMLRDWGFVAETEGSYVLGPMCLQLAWGFDEVAFLQRTALPGLQWLAAETGETVGLMAALHDQAVCIEMIESPQPLRCAFDKGRGLPLSRGASARALLAAMPREARAGAVDRLLRSGHDGPAAAMDDAACAAILAAGHVVTEGEVDPGVWGVSVPLLRAHGRLPAALTLMAPAVRGTARAAGLIRLTTDAATRIVREIEATA